MKLHSRVLVLLLACVMLLGLLSACTSEPTGESTPAASTPTASTGSAATPADDSTQPEDTAASGLPLVSEPTTFTAWIPFTSSYVSGYTVTADYIGTVSHISLDRVRYVAIFEGVSLAPEEPEPTETPAPVETPAPTEASSAEGAPSADQQDVQKNMEELSAEIPWKLVVIPFGIIALIGAGVGVALTMKRRSEVSEIGENEEDEDE